MISPHVSVVATVSPKGGVGKTTLVANLAEALAATGRPVLVIDLDPQNSLRLHHQMPVEQSGGLAVQELHGASWSDAIYQGAYGVSCLPYGTLAEPHRREFEVRVDADADWLSKRLKQMNLAAGTIVLVDTPPGGTVYLRQALGVADAVLAVLLPDAASFVTIPSMERWMDDYCRNRSGFIGGWYVLNRMNSARVLCRDVSAVLAQQLGDKLAPQSIQFDAAVEEALASQAPVTHYAPESVATRDIRALADWLTQILRG